MKRFLSLFFVLCLVVSLAACHAGHDHGDETQTPTQTQKLNYLDGNVSQDSVDEFLTLLTQAQSAGQFAGLSTERANWYNVTPTEVSASSDYTIFKESTSCASLVLIDGALYELCPSFGGYGFVNATLCDVDGNGTKDLLVASSSGSGVHTATVSLFNATTHTSTEVYRTTETDLFVLAATTTEGGVGMYVCAAKIEIKNNNPAQLSYAATRLLGTVAIQNGQAVFQPMK
ncbi:MAG: hypothetical protein IJX28_00065 [Clostridia bacterium]|nr:hypothetical protein [Clostridia bacterium]